MIPVLTDEEKQAIIDRLTTLGYSVGESDTMGLNFTGSAVKAHILNQINHSTLPDELQPLFVDMCCGEFLNAKSSTGVLPNMNVDEALQSVSMGDVSVSYNPSLTTAGKFNALVDTLINGRKDDLICYRKIRW